MGWVENYGKESAVAMWLPRHERICSARMRCNKTERPGSHELGRIGTTEEWTLVHTDVRQHLIHEVPLRNSPDDLLDHLTSLEHH